MGTYFVTVCTHNRTHYFGEICDGKITHTEIGAYLCRAIEEIGLHYPEATVDRYVVMPNHFHAIITIVRSQHAAADNANNAVANVRSRHAAADNANNAVANVGSRHAAADNANNAAANVRSRHAAADNANNAAANVGSRHAAADNATPNTGCLHPAQHPDIDDNFNERNHFNAMLSRTLGGLKSAVSKQAHLSDSTFRWQPNFHDHIIRNQREYDLIANYIDNNVLNWNKDKFNSYT